MDIVCQILDRRSHLVETPPYLINSDDIYMCCLQWNILLEVYWSTQVVLVDAGCTGRRRLYWSTQVVLVDTGCTGRRRLYWSTQVVLVDAGCTAAFRGMSSFIIQVKIKQTYSWNTTTQLHSMLTITYQTFVGDIIVI